MYKLKIEENCKQKYAKEENHALLGMERLKGDET